MKVLLFMMLVLLAASVLAQDCAQDGSCNMECIDNTIDYYDPDCSIGEVELYGLSTEVVEEIPIQVDQSPEQSPIIVRPCPPIKDGVCETTCDGLDLDCLCGDLSCQPHETYATCPSDCVHEINKLCPIIRDGFCDDTCRPFDADCAKERMATGIAHAEEEWGISMRTIQTTLVIILLLLCGWILYLLHKAHELREKR